MFIYSTHCNVDVLGIARGEDYCEVDDALHGDMEVVVKAQDLGDFHI